MPKAAVAAPPINSSRLVGIDRFLSHDILNSVRSRPKEDERAAGAIVVFSAAISEPDTAEGARHATRESAFVFDQPQSVSGHFHPPSHCVAHVPAPRQRSRSKTARARGGRSSDQSGSLTKGARIHQPPPSHD